MPKHRPALAVIVGTRPNLIKVASLFRYWQEQPATIDLRLVHTGQHYDESMSGEIARSLELPPPDYQFASREKEFSHRLGNMTAKIAKHLRQKKYDGVVVVGDVDSTLAGALAARRAQLPLFHVEAGLRSRDRRMPEEINRIVVDQLSDFCFTTEPAAHEHLLAEGKPSAVQELVGNLMIESLLRFSPHLSTPWLKRLELTPRKYVVATLHRFESIQDPLLLSHLVELLVTVSQHWPVVFPLHPATRQKLPTSLRRQLTKHCHVLEPLSYFSFLGLVDQSLGVLTDSGGIQEETTHLRIPCCTLRDNTERPITMEKGTNRLFPPASARWEDISVQLQRDFSHLQPIPYWDDQVSARIFRRFERWYA